jgi:hypothetical protein
MKLREEIKCRHCKRQAATRQDLDGRPYCLGCAMNVFGYLKWDVDTQRLGEPTPLQRGCAHQRLNMDGVCFACGADRRGI